MKTPWTPWPIRTLHLFGVGSLGAFATLIVIQVIGDIFASAGDFSGFGGFGQVLIIAEALRWAVIPIAFVLCYLLLRGFGERQYSLNVSFMACVGIYVVFEICRIFGLTTPGIYFLLAFSGGAWCVFCGFIVRAITAQSTRIGVAAITMSILVLTPPIVVEPIAAWESRRVETRLTKLFRESVAFTPYVSPEPAIRAIIQEGDGGTAIVAFMADPYTYVFEGEVMSGQDKTVQPPALCNLRQLYQAMDNLGSWQAVLGIERPGTSTCEVIATTPKGRIIYGEKPAGEGERTYYVRLEETNIVLRYARSHVDELGADFPAYISSLVDSLEPVTVESLPVADLY